MAQLLIVEDDRITALALQRAVTRLGHTVVACTDSAAEALAAVHAYQPDVVLLDIHLRGRQDGVLVGTEIQARWSIPVVYLSGSDPTQFGLPDGPDACWCALTKPIDMAHLGHILAQLFPSPPRHPYAPVSGVEDPASPICHSTQELRAQLRQWRQPVRPF